ncbi:MAG: dockerin type I repeat-containing protein, partial [Planctomycetota bacterium]
PAGSGEPLHYPIEVEIDGDPFPLQFLTSLGSHVPTYQDGEIVIYNAPTLRIGRGEEDFQGQPLRAPVQLWSDKKIEENMYLVFALGLDFEDLWLKGDTEGTLLAGVDIGIPLHPSPGVFVWNIKLRALGVEILPAQGEVLLWLTLYYPQPVQGEISVELTDESRLDEVELVNTIPGVFVYLDHFLRGDPNFDGSTNIPDAVFLVNYFMRGGEAPICPDSGDVNDDGLLNVADVVYLLSYLFSSGPFPADPFPFNGADPTPDSLPCFPALPK